MNVNAFSLPSLAVALVLSANAHALDWDYTLGTGVTHSGNVSRLPSNTLDETALVTDVGLVASGDSEDIDFNLATRIRSLNYDRGVFDDELLGVLTSNASFRIGNNVRWVVADRYGQSIIDPLRTVTQDNRENINVFVTGPEFSFDIGAGNRIQSSLKVADSFYEETNNDSNRYSADISWNRQSTATQAIGLTFAADATRYKDVSSSDFNRFRLFGHWESNLPRNKISIDLGFDQLKPTDQDLVVNDDISNYTRLVWQRPLGDQSSASLSFTSEYTETGDHFISDTAQFSQFLRGTDDPTSFAAINNFYDFNEVVGSWNRRGVSVSTNLRAYWRDEDYTNKEIAPRDRTEEGVDLYVTIPVGVRRSFDLYGGIRQIEYHISLVEFDDSYGGLFFKQQVGKNFSADLRLDYIDRESPDSTLSYTELRGAFTINWGSGLDGIVRGDF